MSDYSTPEIIFKHFNENKLTSKQALKSLESLLTECEVETIRSSALEFIARLPDKGDHVYRILEKALISDESPEVKYQAIKIILEQYGSASPDPILWLIDNENSIRFFKLLLDYLLKYEPTRLLSNIETKVLEKLNKFYDLDKKELQVILDIECIEAEKFTRNLIDFSSKFDVSDEYKRQLMKENTEVGYKGLKWIKKTQNKKIESLKLTGLNTIPSTIQNLTHLKNLDIDHCVIKDPEIKHFKLENLEQLKLPNNELEFVPEWVWRVAIKPNYTQNYLKMEVNLENAQILGLLEILSGESFFRIMDFKDTKHIYKNSFIIDDIGALIGIYIISKRNKIGIIPEKLCSLNRLMELKMISQNVKEIPACLLSLKSLSRLDLRGNPLTHEKEFYNKLMNLKSFSI
jgi:hypothetical protein